ncbi:Hypothetical protein NCS54_00913400 [Fusarium falciforme]|uniref:Hypothetical protein n=1 Tax=Fusarium falciforme TaxID=195108 RepID=UPI0023015DAB|nr:Hypothetical protein NCS54_00913400 [Fusarium falciforme]WAO91654.1 Hypothetical protein NCS54_00913400 [Fusarium falciforme]
MAEAIGIAGSVVGIVAFGLQLGVTLQTHIEAAVEASDWLQEIAFEINFTAAVLSQLQGIMKKDCDAAAPIFSIDGVRDIKRLSDRCKRIYDVIIILLNEAAEGSKNKKVKREVSADGLDDLSLKLNNHPTRAPGSLEEEQALRELAQELMRKRANHAKQLMQRHTEKADKAMAAAPTTKPESVGPPPGETISYYSGIKQPEALPLLAMTTHDAESGNRKEDGLDKPIVNPSPQPDGTEAMVESDRPQRQDRNMIEHAVHPLSNGFQGREAPSTPPPPPFFYRHPHTASDVVAEDETSGDYSPSTSSQEDGGSQYDDGGSIRGSTGAPTNTTSSNLILRFIPNWAQGIFSRGRHDGRENDRLEAFLLELPARTDLESKPSLMKLEMEQKLIDAALSAIVPRRWQRGRWQMWEQYKAVDSRVRHEIYLAITLSKQWDKQSRTWIAIEVTQSSELGQPESVHIVLFFRLVLSDHEPRSPQQVGTIVPPSPTTDSESTTNFDKHDLDEEIEGLLGPEEIITGEIDTSQLDLGELLKRWTNTPDAGGNGVLSSEPDI